MKLIPFLLAAVVCLSAGQGAWAQDDGKGRDKDKDKDKKYEYDKDRSEKAYEAEKKRSEEARKDYQERQKDAAERYKERRNDRDDDRDRTTTPATRPGTRVGDVLGKVILPPAGTPGPRQLEGVPRGQYPPPGQCRIWYPDRPAGHQPPPASCESLRGARLERGAFILHGDRAYDADYDWQAEEKRRPGTVVRDVLDILLPRR